jgi:hypothetical protein
LVVGQTTSVPYSGNTGSTNFTLSGTSNPSTARPSITLKNSDDSVRAWWVIDANNGAFIGTQSNNYFGFQTNNTERARIDSDGNFTLRNSSDNVVIGNAVTGGMYLGGGSSNTNLMVFQVGASERARITSDGALLVGKTSDTFSAAGARISSGGVMTLTTPANELANFNRLTDDGILLYFSQDSSIEGSISVSGTTVSYNGGHLSRWAQTLGPKDDTLLKGTVLANLDEMNVYTDADGNPVDNEQLNKVKVSDVEGDANVAGVFVNWDHDKAHDVDEINMAMTGDMIIRIAQGVTVQRGDLLMSAGDGTAKPQGDDIVRSKTVAKVTSTHVTCTYADGSYCVPCVLMAC